MRFSFKVRVRFSPARELVGEKQITGIISYIGKGESYIVGKGEKDVVPRLIKVGGLELFYWEQVVTC